ncbi:hypothetical protein CVU76_03680 [Candidatus Dojkabacteria bacterium HGW-Dojkabacteria-1]|uniref:Metallo-beta-lactamase domain-containing protein n=1 Tax=Candidatus Dojkabacteria bacterium HGW-Dojkabacteria-1 TaxID=2013761 RepID=A0A2N2F4F6_9BACT|nr:MAG: hypothetical protein CVU76_03680 [Candidatus Dojkabacteria bacterium HGW-Dojkabacteria-1]
MKITTLKNPKVLLGKFFGILFWLLLFSLYFINQKPQNLVVFLDVGQGDATLIQNGNVQVLIDGGPDRSILYELPKYMPFFDRKIEYLVLTHPHEDHIKGFLYVLENYEVGQILYYPVCYENNSYKSLLQSGVNIREVFAGDSISLESLNINIIWPRVEKYNKGECIKPWNNNINNDSLVMEFEFLEKKYLLMGDSEKEVEKILLKEKIISNKYHVLKAGHHCSKTSSSETFLEFVSPTYVICSAGIKNKFGHPSSETLKTFDSLGSILSEYVVHS